MKYLGLIASFFIASVISSCIEMPLMGTSTKTGGETVKVEDPYTPENMKRALVALVAKNSATGSALGKSSAYTEAEEFNLEPNYLYVRFLPKGDAEKRELFNRDTELVLFDTPMDFRVNQDGINPGYLDTALPDTVKPYFAAVPKDYPFGNEIAYEVIKPLFLVQPLVSALDTLESPDPVLQKVGSSPNARSLVAFLKKYHLSIQDLELASLELTGNLDSSFFKVAPNGLAKRAFWDRWRPNGTLNYQDSKLGVKPVVGVRVTAGYSYYWRSSRTNATGYFSSPERWTYSVKYKAHWDADDFLMEDNESWYGADLVTEGPTSYQPWNRTFTDLNAAYAVIFMAAYDFYYGNISSLNRPKQNGWLSFALDLQISSGSGSDYGVHTVVPWLANWIVIWTKENSAYRSSDGLYATTIHELTHSSHYCSFKTRYTWVPRDFEWTNYMGHDVEETWARGVQWWLTGMKYPGYAVPFYSGNYKGVVQDLIDADANYSDNLAAGDLVRGFTVRQIEIAVEKSFNLTELRDNLKSMYPNGTGPAYTNAGMDALFAYWAAR